MKDNVKSYQNALNKPKTATSRVNSQDLHKIRIKTVRGKTTLRGDVHSWVALQEAISAAWKII